MNRRPGMKQARVVAVCRAGYREIEIEAGGNVARCMHTDVGFIDVRPVHGGKQERLDIHNVPGDRRYVGAKLWIGFDGARPFVEARA